MDSIWHFLHYFKTTRKTGFNKRILRNCVYCHACKYCDFLHNQLIPFCIIQLSSYTQLLPYSKIVYLLHR